MTSTVEANGLTIAQNKSIKSAKTTKKTGILKGSNNANSNVVKVFDSKGKLKHTFFGDFTEGSRILNLPTTALKNSYRNDTHIYSTKIGRTRAKNSGFEKYIGWYAVNLGKCKDYKQIVDSSTTVGVDLYNGV